MIKKAIFITLLFIPLFAHTEQKNVGLCIMATGKYIQFVMPLIESARKHFCIEHKITYFVFTDGLLPEAHDIVVIPQQRLGWPYDTMMRCKVYYDHKDVLQTQDYIFALDADMLFVGDMGNELLSERVATFHPGYYGRKGPYESRSTSTAYLPEVQARFYFAGGFYGGSAQEFIAINGTMSNNIQIDLNNNIVAVWHDESHLNRYFATHSPTMILTPDYCYPQSFPRDQVWLFQFKPRLLALDKNHNEMRQ